MWTPWCLRAFVVPFRAFPTKDLSCPIGCKSRLVVFTIDVSKHSPSCPPDSCANSAAKARIRCSRSALVAILGSSDSPDSNPLPDALAKTEPDLLSDRAKSAKCNLHPGNSGDSVCSGSSLHRCARSCFLDTIPAINESRCPRRCASTALAAALAALWLAGCSIQRPVGLYWQRTGACNRQAAALV